MALQQISTFVHRDDSTGKTYGFGRHRPTTLPKAYFLEFLTSTPLPTPPATCDWSPKAANSLNKIYLNDQLGDCVIAGLGHMIGVWSGNTTGTPILLTDAQIRSEYQICGGGDNGCSEQDVLTNFSQNDFNGVSGSKLLGFTGVNAADKSLCMSCVQLFGGLILGLELPNAYTNPMPQKSGFVWDVAGRPNPNQGHCIVAVGYTAQGVIVSTWAMLGTLTWAALAKYCVSAAGGELYAAMSPEWLSTAKQMAPNAIDYFHLSQYFNSIGGSVPVPSGPPGPIPPPAPLNTDLVTIDYTNKQITGLPDPSSWTLT
jgi:hypothetical protein